MRPPIIALALLAAVGGGDLALAQTRRVVEYEKDGVHYRDTVESVRLPVSETRYEENREEVLREEYKTQVLKQQRTVFQAVPETRWEPRVHGWWNPFRTNRVYWRPVTSYRWEPRTQTIETPVTRREYVPESRTIRRPVTTLRFVPQERLVSRVVVTPPASAGPRPLSPAATPEAIVHGRPLPEPAASTARREVLGGITLESDPPRQGPRLPASGWR